MRTNTKATRTTRRRLGIRRGIAVASALACTAALASTSVAGAARSSSVLGPKDVAEGEPVKIGMVSDGRDANIDNEYQISESEAIVEYLNQHRGGIGGRPIELIHCETGNAQPAKSTECANELIQDGVVLILMPEATGVSQVHQVTSQAKVPLWIYSITDTNLTTDTSGYTFVLFDPRSSVSALPISVAKANKVKKVTPVVIDVPAATDLYSSESGKAPFEDANIELEMIPVPLGQADMTPQMTEIANGDPTVVQIIGTDAFCISAMKGLKAAAFDGPISTLFLCITDATRTALGSDLEGVFIATSSPIGDKKSEGYKQLKAIVDTYADDGSVPDLNKAQNTYAVWMGLFEAIKDMTGDITPDTVAQTIQSMPNMEIPGSGLQYRCNGKAKPELPAVCAAGGLRSRLNAKGLPSLPYKVVGNAPVPD